MLHNSFKKMFLAVVAVSVLGLSACDRGLEEMNIDPNQPNQVPAENLLTQAQLQLNQLFWGRAANAEFAMLMVQHFAQNEYAEDSRYTIPSANFDGIWNTAYAGGLNDLEMAKHIVQNNEGINEAVRNNQLAVLEIMQVWAFHNLTDMFGDIPYSEALGEETHPSYDPQSEIYPDLIARLTAASNQIQPSAAGFRTGDNVYQGDMGKWKLLANSLKLRIAMRMSDVNTAAASAAVSEAVAAGVITDFDEAATYEFDPQAALANPLYIDRVINRRDDFSVSATLLEFMQAGNDPRIPAYADPNVSGNYVGMPYGLTDAEAFARQGNTSRPDEALRQQQSEAIMMGPVEVHFLLAEAAERGFINTGSAAEYYRTALEQSMEYWGVSETAATAYIAANPYSSANWRQVIGEEKWVALYMQGLQAWAEWRRLDAPNLPFPAAADPSVSSIPVRALYPAGEEGTNAVSLAAAGSNTLTTKVWWDVN